MNALLQWNDDRPDVFRARCRSGVTYRIGRDGPAAWWLKATQPDGTETTLSSGHLADMKALANMDEAARRPKTAPQSIAWTRIKNGHWWGVSTAGTAYKIVRVGRLMGETLWRLEEFAAHAKHGSAMTEDAERGDPLDEGTLNAMKKRATMAAGEAATIREAAE